MKPPPFEYCRADTLDEAVALLAEFGNDGAVLAGGMSLGAMLNMRLVHPAAVIDVNRIPGLGAIAPSDAWLETGATCLQAEALRSETVAAFVPLLALALPSVGHFQTRNRGTLGGSAAHADPSAEIPLCLVTLGGEVALASKSRRRVVAAEEFFQGILTTAREPDEMITALRWPARKPGDGYAFEEIAQRRGDFAIAAAAATAGLEPDGAIRSLSFGLGGVEDRPILVDTARFVGAPASAGTAAALAEEAAASVEPVEDVQANADYRRQLVRVLGRRVLESAFARSHAEEAEG